MFQSNVRRDIMNYASVRDGDEQNYVKKYIAHPFNHNSNNSKRLSAI